MRVLIVDDDEDDVLLARSDAARRSTARSATSSTPRRDLAGPWSPAWTGRVTTPTWSTTGSAAHTGFDVAQRDPRPLPACPGDHAHRAWTTARSTCGRPSSGIADYLVKGQLDARHARALAALRDPAPARAARARRVRGALRPGAGRRQRRPVGLGPRARTASTSRRAAEAMLGDHEARLDGNARDWLERVHPDDRAAGRAGRARPPRRARPSTSRPSTACAPTDGS